MSGTRGRGSYRRSSRNGSVSNAAAQEALDAALRRAEEQRQTETSTSRSQSSDSLATWRGTPGVSSELPGSATTPPGVQGPGGTPPAGGVTRGLSAPQLPTAGGT